MRLKYIELFGFKTFKEKIRIPFDPGINIIVGPNGCGKTNIVDAIRFILGEQNLKELRLKNMSDLIFNGSDSGNESSVALCRGVLVNSEHPDFKYKDFSELTVDRRHFRNKEAEYRINGINVGYREYLNFFNASSLSRHFSIVDASKINALLNYKPQDLRLFFEEVSGITKYKSQKKAAARKLEGAQINLLRINDLHTEVESRLSSLKSQSELLGKYRDAEDKKIRHEYVLHERSRKRINSELDKHKREYEAHSLQLLEEESKTLKADKDLSELKVFSDGMMEHHRVLSEDKSGMLVEITKLTSAIEYELISVKNLGAEIEAKKKEMEEQLSLKAIAGEKLKDLINKKSEVETDLLNLKTLLQNLEKVTVEKKSKVLDLREKLGNSSDEYLEAVEKIQNIKNKLSFIVKNLKDIEGRKANGDDLVLRTKKEIEGVQSIISMKNEFLEETAGRLKTLKERRDLEESRLKGLQDNQELLKKEKDEAEKSISLIRITINQLRGLIEKREGFSEGTKRFLNSEKDYGASPIYDLISVETGFENVVWSGFEDLLETVVVEDIDKAAKAIEFINNNKIGEVRMFVPGQITGGAGAEEYNLSNIPFNEPDLVGLVKLGDKIKLNREGISFSDLRREIYYFKETKGVLNFIKQNGRFPDLIVITGDGVTFLPGGYIIAGKNKDLESQNMLINRNRLNEYEKELNEKEKAFLQKNDLYVKIQDEIQEVSRDINIISMDIREKELEESTLKNDLKHLEDQALKNRERLVIIEKDLENLAMENDSLLKDEVLMRDELKTLEEGLGQISRKREEIEEGLGILEMEFEKAKEEEVSMKIEINSTEKNLGFLGSDINNLEEGVSGYAKKIENLTDQLENVKNEILKTNNSITERRENLKRVDSSLALKEDEISKTGTEIERIREEILKAEKALDSAKRIKNNVEKKRDSSLTYVNMYNEKLSEIEGSLNNFSNIEPFDFEGDEYKNLTEEEIKKVIDASKEEMFRLGDVNMNAANDYNEALTRSEFLMSQKQDLENSINSLEGIIKKLDKISREKFNLSLNQIKEKFNELFVFLFGGGSADISSFRQDNGYEQEEDDSRPMGMEINVQIPGKKLSGINVLSQGERVLVAISLLFSIFLTKKTPFCVIDEVDAPLDYANNARYNKLIEEISTRSQVIMVTHNKKTMEIGKNIFGVTSRKHGVSKIVSVAMKPSGG